MARCNISAILFLNQFPGLIGLHGLFKSGYGGKGRIIHNDLGTGNSLLHGGGQTGGVDAKAAVSRQINHHFIRCV